MIEILRQHIINRLGQEPENLDLVVLHFTAVKIKRGEHLLMQIAFLTSSCILALIDLSLEKCNYFVLFSLND